MVVKYVIQTLILKACNRPENDFWGLGDIIRGTIQLYQLSKKYNFELIVDKQHHPISNYLINRYHQFSDVITSYKNKVAFVDIDQCEKFILKYSKNPSAGLIFFTNDFFHGPITEDCKAFIKYHFTPNNDFLDYINEKINSLPFKEYNILHYRLGDNVLIKNMQNKKININSIISNINKYHNEEENTILISDSMDLKKRAKKETNIFMFDSVLAHMGCSNDIKDTLFEFFLITNSKKIKTFSVYWWTSGFVKISNDIFDVPLERIK
jgi:hypothetical protein